MIASLDIQTVARQAAESALCHLAYREGITYTDDEYEIKVAAMAVVIANQLDSTSTFPQRIADGAYLIPTAEVYAVDSDSTDRVHQVTYDTLTGGASCNGPHCRGRTCKHIRKVLKNRNKESE